MGSKGLEAPASGIQGSMGGGFSVAQAVSSRAGSSPSNLDSKGSFSASRVLARLTKGLVKLSSQALRELNFLFQETDPELFFEGLLRFGQGQQASGRMDVAAEVYGLLVSPVGARPIAPESSVGKISRPENGSDLPAGRQVNQDPYKTIPVPIQVRARKELDALMGRGAFAPRFEFLSSQFVDSATDPSLLFALTSAGAAFKLTRFLTLRGLASSSLPNFIKTGFGARAAASLTAFGVEAPLFPIAGKVGSEILGREVDWSGKTLKHEIKSSILVLGGLKLVGWGVGAGFHKLHGVDPITGQVKRLETLSKLSQPLMPQLGMLGGIMLGHKAEEIAGLRKPMDGATTLTDSLAMLLQFGIAGRINQRALPGLHRLEAMLDAKARHDGLASKGSNPKLENFQTLWGLSPALQPAGRIPNHVNHGIFFRKGNGLPPEGKNGPPPGKPPQEPRDYQYKILNAINADLSQDTHPWLGIASPMQTGKSYLIKYIIPQAKKILGPQTKVLVLHYGRIITKQLMDDITGAFSSSEVGKLDGLKKEIKPITVASIPTLHQDKYLEQFNPKDGPYLIVFDEAILSHTPTGRKILKHFGLGEVIRDEESNRLVFQAKASPHARLIGLSGTSNGLEGYHLSKDAQFSLLDAMEGRWIREMIGERVFPDISSQRMKGPLEKMIWWKATEENARALAKIYLDQIRSRGKKNLVFVPTTTHGKLFQKALAKLAPKEKSYFIHYKREGEDIEADLEAWKQDGGVMISIKMLSYSFQAEGADASFHTYQTSSSELFATRTGRGWGVEEGKSYQPYYVLEVTWDRSERFSNLAKLVGLEDYPRDRLVIKPGFKKIVKAIQRRKALEEKLKQQITLGEVVPYFEQVPLLEGWRRQFGKWLQQAGSLEKMAEQTGLPKEVLYGFSLGALPTRINEVRGLASFFPTEAQALQAWVKVWETVVDELYSGTRLLAKGMESELTQWKNQVLTPSEKATALEQILQKVFHREKRSQASIDEERRFWAFVSAIKEAEALFNESRNPISFYEIARRAAFFYNQGLPKEKQAKKRTFEGYLSTDKRRDPRLVEMLLHSKAVKKKKQVYIDFERRFWAFVTALHEVEKKFKGSRKTVRPTYTADRALHFYNQGLPKEEQSTVGTFRTYLKLSKHLDPRLEKMVRRSKAVKKINQTSINRKRRFWAFVKAIQETETQFQGSGKTISLQNIADLAAHFYNQGLPKKQQITKPPFRHNFGHRRYQDPRLEKMALRSKAVKKKKTVDPERRFWAFVSAIQEAEAQHLNSGKMLPFQQTSGRAMHFYNEGIPKEDQISGLTFRAYLGNQKHQDPRLEKMVLRSKVLKKQRNASIDPERRFWAFVSAFQEAEAQFQGSGKSASPPQLAHLAAKFYNQGLPKKDWSTEGTFYNYFSNSKHRDPRLEKMALRSKAIKKQKQTRIDPERRFWAFVKAIQEAEAKFQTSGKSESQTNIAKRAVYFYNQGLPKGMQSTASTFRSYLGAQEHQDPRLLEMVLKLKAVKKRR